MRALLVAIALAVAVSARGDDADPAAEMRPLGDPLPERLQKLEQEWADEIGTRSLDEERAEPADEDEERPPSEEPADDDEHRSRTGVNEEAADPEPTPVVPIEPPVHAKPPSASAPRSDRPPPHGGRATTTPRTAPEASDQEDHRPRAPREAVPAD